MAPNMKRVRLGPQGRAVIPVELRKELGIQAGDDLVAWVDDGRLIFRRREDIQQELWDMFAHVDGSMVDELIAERRREAEREARREAEYGL